MKKTRSSPRSFALSYCIRQIAGKQSPISESAWRGRAKHVRRSAGKGTQETRIVILRGRDEIVSISAILNFLDSWVPHTFPVVNSKLLRVQRRATEIQS
jgi:hypothetical protein